MDNFNLKLVKQIGADNGFRIDFGINLEAIDEDYDDESIINSLFLSVAYQTMIMTKIKSQSRMAFRNSCK